MAKTVPPFAAPAWISASQRRDPETSSPQAVRPTCRSSAQSHERR